MKQEMNEAIWMKLLQAQNAQEAAEILRAEGENAPRRMCPISGRRLNAAKRI